MSDDKKHDSDFDDCISAEEINKVGDDVPKGINDINRQEALGLINKIMRSLVELIDIIFGKKNNG